MKIIPAIFDEHEIRRAYDEESEIRNKLTDYRASHDISKDGGYAILTNLIHQEWSGVSVKEHKDLKGLKPQNLRDPMITKIRGATASGSQVRASVPTNGPQRENAGEWSCDLSKRKAFPIHPFASYQYFANDCRDAEIVIVDEGNQSQGGDPADFRGVLVNSGIHGHVAHVG